MKLLWKRLTSLGKKGLSLTEMICAMAVLAVLGTAITGVMMVSASSFRSENNETRVQEEAQLVVNQISDFLIDSTATVEFNSNTLFITQGNKQYRINYVPADEELYFQEFDYNPAGGSYTPSSSSQLMAENLKDFSADCSDFAQTGSVKVKLDFEREVAGGNRIFPTEYIVTSRNKEVVSATTSTAMITVPNQLVLIPGEDFTFAPVVAGVSNTSLIWTLINNTDSATTISSTGHVSLGKSENATLIKAHAETAERIGGRPAAEAWVDIHVRRVNAINGTLTLVSGTEGTAGAVYQVEIDSVLGTSLADDGSSYSPVLPDNDAEVITWDLAGLPCTTQTLDPKGKILKITLTSNLTADTTITAWSAHANDANRANSDYDILNEVKKEFTFTGGSPLTPPWTAGGGWMRESNMSQADILNFNEFAQAIGDSKGESGWQNYTWDAEYRFRKTIDVDWSKYYPAASVNGADGANSAKINLRPVITAVMEPIYDYELQIRFYIKDTSGRRVWPMDERIGQTQPDPSINPDLYLITGTMPATKVYFKSNVIRVMDSIGNTPESAYTLDIAKDTEYLMLEYSKVEGTDDSGNSFTNSLQYIMEMEQGGSWVVVSDTTNNGAYEGTYHINQQQGMIDRVYFRNEMSRTGKYRIKVFCNNRPNMTLNDDGTVTNHGNDRVDKLYDEALGIGVFYFNVN